MVVLPAEPVTAITRGFQRLKARLAKNRKYFATEKYRRFFNLLAVMQQLYHRTHKNADFG